MDKAYLLSSILNNIKINVICADITKCTQRWRDYDYTPEYCKLYYILKGEGRVVIDDVEYFPKPGQICLLPANTKQSYEVINHNEYLKYWTHFTCESAERSIFDIIKAPYLIDVKSDLIHTRLKSIFEKMIDYSKNKKFISNLMVESCIKELIAIYLEQVDINEIYIKNSKESERQRVILKYINNNLDKKLTINDLAKTLYLHPNYFINYFKKTFGVSPKIY